MKARVAYGVILGGSLTFLVSLYLPWYVTRKPLFPDVTGAAQSHTATLDGDSTVLTARDRSAS